MEKGKKPKLGGKKKGSVMEHEAHGFFFFFFWCEKEGAGGVASLVNEKIDCILYCITICLLVSR